MADDVKKINVTSSQANDAVATGVIDEQFDGIKSELISRFELLPDDIKKAITDDAYQTKLFTIAKERKMTYEELGTMETETTMVLLGMTKPADFRDELQLELKKNDEEIDSLVKTINEQVFLPIRASLERVYAAKKEPIDFLKETEPTITTPETPSQPVINTTPTPTPVLSTEDHAILAKTGVVISETPKPVIPMQTAQMPNRADVLKGIENPQKSSSFGIVADKLNTAGTVMPTKTTDYSVAKNPTPGEGITNPPPARTSSDPYREPIS